MVTLIDVLYKMGIDGSRTETKAGCDFNVCITNDVEESEAEFMARYGTGNTYYFRLENYHHGRKLAAALYKRLTGHIYDLPENLMPKFTLSKNLYFFVHVKSARDVRKELVLN